jgi:hypothetical protein
MRRIISVVAVAALMAAMVAVAALPAFAVGKPPPTSCGAGDVLSNFATTVGGIGKEFQATEDNPGEELRVLKEFDVYPVCHLDDPGQTP